MTVVRHNCMPRAMEYSTDWKLVLAIHCCIGSFTMPNVFVISSMQDVDNTRVTLDYRRLSTVCC